MGKGRAYGIDREYQIFCRDVLIKEYPNLIPEGKDGIDIPFKFGNTTWTFDIVLKSPPEDLLVAECRRRKAPIKQGQIAEFAHKVELARKHLSMGVAGFFFAKTSYQKGAITAGDDEGIAIVELNEGQELKAFRITYLRYDVSREKRLKKAVDHYQGEVGLKLTPKSDYKYMPPQKGKKKK